MTHTYTEFGWHGCSVTKSCPTLCKPMGYSMPGLPVLHYLPEFAQIHVRWVSDAINHLILCCPLLLFSFFPASGSFPVSQLFTSGGQSIRASASPLVLPMNIQDLFILGLTGLISLQFKGLSRVFSNTTVQKHQFFRTQPSLWSNFLIHIGKPIALTIQSFVNKVMSHCLDLTAFLPRRKHL